MPSIRNFDSAETVSFFTSTSIPNPNGIIMAVDDVLLTQQAIKDVANIKSIEDR